MKCLQVLAASAFGCLIGISPGVIAGSSSLVATAKPIMILASRTFVFSPRNHKWYAYENGRLVKSGVASGGKRGHRTPQGSFRLISKGGSGCRSHKYPPPNGGAWMGYCMHFKALYAIHASDSVPPRYNASHGCIRVKPWAARWLNHNFLHIGDRVVVTSY